MNISNTLKKIEKALDLRFEKDTTLYISKEDTEKIKKALYNSQFQNINGFIKKFGNKIVGKIILKNSWLIDFEKNKKELKKIFNSIDKDFMKEISRDILEDKIFSTSEFKSFIKKYDLEIIPIDECERIYKDKNENIKHRIRCFRRYLKEKYIKENSLSNVVRFIDDEFNNYHEIYTYAQARKDMLLIPIFENIDNLEEVYKWIIDNKMDKEDKVWRKLFLFNPDIALNQTTKYIDNNPRWDNYKTKFIILKILSKLDKAKEFENKIVELYYSYSNIRLLFIHMIEPPKFKNKELAHSILSKFENIILPPKSDESVEKIKNWKENNKGFDNMEELMLFCDDDSQDFNNPNTLGYANFRLVNTDKQIILQTYYNHTYHENLKKILSYYLANLLVKNGLPKELREINNEEYIEQISYNISKLNINTKYAKKFLEENEKLDLLLKFKQR